MSGWTFDPGFGWRHRPWWKVAVNTALRSLQSRGPGRKLVIATRCVGGNDHDPDDPPRAIGYELRRVEHGDGG